MENDGKTGSFGTSESITFNASGSIQRGQYPVDDICQTCRDANGPSYFWVMINAAGTATLQCVHCGEQKSVASHTLKRLPNDAQPPSDPDE